MTPPPTSTPTIPLSELSKKIKEVKIVEVGPRDGLQNEKAILSTEEKFLFIEKLIAAGLKTIEVTSFVKAESIPQMQDATELFQKIRKKYKAKNPEISFPCLVPNIHGLEKALDVGATDIALFTSTSEKFNQKNINASIEESFKRIKLVVDECYKLGDKVGVKLRGYISTAFGCPYEGNIPIKKLKEVIKRFNDLGVFELSLGDTIGVANPLQVDQILNELQKNCDLDHISMHFHDTRGMALANVVASLMMGIKTFDSSAGGLGGCPYARGATGNVATEDLCYLFQSMGIGTGVSMDKLVEASHYILGQLKKETSSKFLKYYLNTHLVK